MIESASNARWLYHSPVYSDVEAKMRRFLVDLGNADKIIGVQMCITIKNKLFL
ncbi:hypothetical protein Hanom_Chr15g01390221 [Helianthus anomalus]